MHVLIDDDERHVSDEEILSLKYIQKDRPYNRVLSKINALIKRKSKSKKADNEADADSDELEKPDSIPIAQHYNPDRSLIYEEVRSSRESNFTVVVEQVSIFLTTDGTVITFFQVNPTLLSLTLAQWQSRRGADHATFERKHHDASEI